MTMTEDIDHVIRRWTTRLAGIPGAVTVLLKGSHVIGTAGPHSDIDFDVLVDGETTEAYPFWLERTRDDRLRHISVAVQDLAGWEEGAEPEPWAFGLPVHEPLRMLWAATPALRERLNQPFRLHPVADPEIEDAIESLGKMHNALGSGDDLGLRQAAHALARYVPTILRPLNPDVVATSPRSALNAILAFPVVPPGHHSDMLACLGMCTSAVPADDLFAAGSRLLSGVITLAAAHESQITPLLPPDLASYLRDGTLARYVTQLRGT